MHKKHFSLANGLALALILTGAGCSNNTTVSSNLETDENKVQAEQNATSQTEVKDNGSENIQKGSETKTAISNDTKTTENKNIITPQIEVKTKTEVKTDVNTEIKTPAVKEFTINAKNWEFSPATITVNKGDKVRLKITSTEGLHSFVLTEYSINTKLEIGQTQIVEFTADKAGSFSFRCGIPCGSGHMDMKGTLIVK